MDDGIQSVATHAMAVFARLLLLLLLLSAGNPGAGGSGRFRRFPVSFDVRDDFASPWPSSFAARACVTPASASAQYLCASSWALSASLALSDRFCLAQIRKRARVHKRANPWQLSFIGRLSTQQLLSCVHTGVANASVCCESSQGRVRSAWEYIASSGGLVSALCSPNEADGVGYCNRSLEAKLCPHVGRCVGSNGIYNSSLMHFHRFGIKPGTLTPENMSMTEVRKTHFCWLLSSSFVFVGATAS
jgi:Papain family cysteine protease